MAHQILTWSVSASPLHLTPPSDSLLFSIYYFAPASHPTHHMVESGAEH